MEQIVRSSTLPAIAVRVDPALPYLGRVEFEVNGRARAEQFYFGEITGGKLARTVIVHFEHFLESNDLTFNYPAFRMIAVGKHDYLHQSWPIAGLGLFENASVAELLKARGVQIDPDWLVNRYARVVDAARKHELLLFYLEPGTSATVPFKMLEAEAHPSGVPQKPGAWATIAAGLADRAMRAFTVIEEDGGTP